ncbi:unnamed protein product, partial [marine sediment metagenome]
ERKLRKLGHRIIAGVDEAGRGPLAGPVVASAVILNKNIKGIRDSKQLSSRRREELFPKIIANSIVGIGIVGESRIDESNIFKATARAMEMAVARLIVPPDYLLVDGLMSFSAACPMLNIIKGDQKSISVAAASIIAKVTRDRIMVACDRFYPDYGFSQHKGYATKQHLVSLEKYGPSPLHRYTFKPIKK